MKSRLLASVSALALMSVAACESDTKIIANEVIVNEDDTVSVSEEANPPCPPAEAAANDACPDNAVE